jgi:hypothetical protein
MHTLYFQPIVFTPVVVWLIDVGPKVAASISKVCLKFLTFVVAGVLFHGVFALAVDLNVDPPQVDLPPSKVGYVVGQPSKL